MKRMLFILPFILCFSAFSEEVDPEKDCKKLEERIELHCPLMKDECENLGSCVVRRDTCLSDGIPETEKSCESVDACMKKYNKKFLKDDCRYEWRKDEKDKKGGVCRVKDLAWKYDGHCPGRIFGLLSAFGYGLSVTVDSDFDCDGGNRKYKAVRKDCIKYKKKYIKSCPDPDIEKYLSKFPVLKCAVSDEFKPKNYGNKYALPGTSGKSDSTKVIDKNRKADHKTGTSKDAKKKGTATKPKK